MMLTAQGGCIIFENLDTSAVKKITVDITGSSNLRIEGGDTNLKKTIEVKPGSSSDVYLRLL
jgi:hypothetical protein